jgi:hypothetical protein
MKMSERSCPVSASVGSVCPMGNGAGENGRARGCNFASFSRPEDIHSTFGVCPYESSSLEIDLINASQIPSDADVTDFLRQRFAFIQIVYDSCSFITENVKQSMSCYTPMSLQCRPLKICKTPKAPKVWTP